MAQLTDFGKSVKMRLIVIDKSQAWLNRQIANQTGMYCDSSRMAKILTGKQKSPVIEAAIKSILDLEEDTT